MIKTDDVQPNYTSDRGLPLDEQATRSQSKIDYLIKIGLGHDYGKLPYYRKVVANPKAAVTQQYLRPYTAELLDNLIDLIFSDTFLWNRVKTLLLRKNRTTISGMSESLSEDGLRSLISKSIEHEIPLETLFQVFSRGAALHEHYPQKSSEQLGFNRVNSFIAGGRARQDDADLLSETTNKQVENKGKETLNLVKRVLRESKGRE